ncbi:MFS transporter [Legionella sp. CNM-4043-24]|uniref:MFS transporter n=1 Tax=Legionella sp. CNM-4043-24 TaxID=3421646 RepID=UPI00403B0033
MNGNNKLATKWFLVFVALFDFMGLGIVVTIFPHLMLSKSSSFLSTSWSYNERLGLLGLFLSVYPLGQFFGAAILGKLSDIYGRRNILFSTVLGTTLAFIASAFSIYIGSATLLFLSRITAGVFAGNIAIVQASMSDISTKETKTKNITLIQVSLGLAWVIGPPLGGWLTEISIVGFSGFMTPFILMSLILGLLSIYTFFGFQETLNVKSNDKVYILSGVKQIVEAFTNKRMRVPFIMWTVFVAGWWLFEAFLPAYLLKVFNFTPGQIGKFLASMGATYAFFQFLIVRPASKWLKPEVMVKYSLIISGLSVISIYFAQNIIMLHVTISLFVGSMAFALPGLISSISNLVDENEQGKIMGTISSIQAMSTVFVMSLGGLVDSFGITSTVVGGGVLLLISWALFIIRFQSPADSDPIHCNQKELTNEC